MSKRQTIAQNMSATAANRAAEEAAYRKLHGKLLPDVQVLQAAGFVVDKMRGGYRVGNDLLTAEQLQEKAARERRLGVAVQGGVRKVTQTATGLRIGDSVPIGVDDKARRSLSGQTPLSAVKDKLTGAALAAKQKAEQTSDDLGPVPRLEWVSKHDIEIDRSYQREMGKANWAHANRIMREWSWLHYQPIVLAPAATRGGLCGD